MENKGEKSGMKKNFTVPLFQSDYPQAFQLPEQFFDICESFFVRHIVDFSKASGQFFVCSGCLFLQQGDEIGRCLVQYQHLREIDLFAAANQYLFAGDVVDDEVGFDGCFHCKQFGGEKRVVGIGKKAAASSEPAAAWMKTLEKVV